VSPGVSVNGGAVSTYLWSEDGSYCVKIVALPHTYTPFHGNPLSRIRIGVLRLLATRCGRGRGEGEFHGGPGKGRRADKLIGQRSSAGIVSNHVVDRRKVRR